MRPGKLRSRLVLEEETRASDGGGGAIISWTQIATIWAEIEPVKGREQTRYEGREATLTHKITLRYRGDVHPDMRLRSGTRIFNIHSVKNEGERNHWLVCQCEEII